MFVKNFSFLTLATVEKEECQQQASKSHSGSFDLNSAPSDLAFISNPISQLRFEHTWEVQSGLSAPLHAVHNKLTHIPKFCEATIGPRKVASIAFHSKRLSLANGGK